MRLQPLNECMQPSTCTTVTPKRKASTCKAPLAVANLLRSSPCSGDPQGKQLPAAGAALPQLGPRPPGALRPAVAAVAVLALPANFSRVCVQPNAPCTTHLDAASCSTCCDLIFSSQDRFIQRVSDILLDPRCTQASGAHLLLCAAPALIWRKPWPCLRLLSCAALAVPAHLPCTKPLLPLLLLQIGCSCNLQLEPAQSEPAHPPPAHQPSLQEIRRVWLGMLSQCDQGLGQKLAAKLQAASAL